VVRIRKLDVNGGDMTTTVSLQEAIKEVNESIENGYLVIDETNEQKTMLKNALGLKEESEVRILPAVRGG